MLDAARTVVKSCDCADHDRLACHKCLLPFSPPHELDRVSRKVAVRVLEQILGVDNDAEPDQQAWLAAVTEEAPRSRSVARNLRWRRSSTPRSSSGCAPSARP